MPMSIVITCLNNAFAEDMSDVTEQAQQEAAQIMMEISAKIQAALEAGSGS